MSILFRCITAGLSAGAVTGILGSGGGMVLIPILSPIFSSSPKSLFPISISIMLPICVASFLLNLSSGSIDFTAFLPYIVGSLIGGLTASAVRGHISVTWLHRIFGIILLWGGFQCILRSA